MKPVARLKAVEHLGPAKQGSKRPHFFVCEDAAGRRRPCLVKQMSDELMAREVVGNRLAAAFGLWTAEPYIVDVTGRALEGASAWFEDHGAFPVFHEGLASGCDQVQVAANFRPTPPLERALLQDVVRLFVFDLWTRYADRTAENPNCALRAGRDGRGVSRRAGGLRLFVFDFEQLFSSGARFTSEEDDADEPWVALASVHCCRQFASGQRGNIIDLESTLVGAQRLDWRKVELSLPSEWRHGAREIIQEIAATRAGKFLESVSTVVQ